MNFGTFGTFAASHSVIIESFLSADLYVTFRGTYKGHDAVVKFFFEASDSNNELAILTFLSRVAPDFRAPRPFLKVKLGREDDDIFVYEGRRYEGVYLMIVYEFIAGEVAPKLSDKGCRESLEKQLKTLHSLGLVYADLRAKNVVRTATGECVLIDYGRAFSASGEPFPPMRYMLEEIGSHGPPTQAQDLEALDAMFAE
jgi:hypothetical protein